MLFEVKGDMENILPISSLDVSQKFSKNEKNLEEFLKRMIGNEVFPQYMIFGNERSLQKEADLFAVDGNGALVVIELKVAGLYDRGKLYQAMDYAQIFSVWQYSDMNEHFRKCFHLNDDETLMSRFEEHFGYRLSESRFNNSQKIVVISNASSLSISSASDYWRTKGIDIEEYFYRFYDIGPKTFLELSSEIFLPEAQRHCWINTCERYIPGAYLDMVREKKASAYGDRKEKIGEWMSKSYVFLYHNGYGIIAAGIGTSRIEIREDNEEKFIKLSKFHHGVNLENGQISKYISAGRIKSLTEQNFYFSNTVVYLSKENAKLLYDECIKEFS
ncbi:MAG: hypothetical protein NT106_04790 [Candidatus Sumerlaeota bacterium]|nr:hypothetical protein [Candidatus Sumerlaeota bacterium]